ncbi:hypothetical protein CRG98_048357 [Punica granatum]|uniref:Uncharacterized protein n=1 Tax=Punica granatum TaxID=22663 RepID=A0A2I0HHS9_PUNGR|nr:hypothetical protein CRG98_048357 [Punica granatum]
MVGSSGTGPLSFHCRERDVFVALSNQPDAAPSTLEAVKPGSLPRGHNPTLGLEWAGQWITTADPAQCNQTMSHATELRNLKVKSGKVLREPRALEGQKSQGNGLIRTHCYATSPPALGSNTVQLSYRAWIELDNHLHKWYQLGYLSSLCSFSEMNEILCPSSTLCLLVESMLLHRNLYGELYRFFQIG